MATPSIPAEGRRVPYPGQQGWGFAAFICILTAALYLGAYAIHKATYKLPTDPTNIPSSETAPANR